MTREYAYTAHGEWYNIILYNILLSEDSAAHAHTESRGGSHT